MLDPQSGVDETQWAAFPGDDVASETGRHVHDPTIIQAGGKYFCFSTGHNGFAFMRCSENLRDWELLEPLLPDRPQWLRARIPEHRSIWAPDVIKTPRGLRIYYCASQRFGWNTSYIGIAECEPFDPANPTRGWRDLGLILQSQRGQDHYNAIDPEIIIDQEHRHWMFFGSYFSGLHVVELDSKTGRLLHPDRPELILVARNTADRENAIEGAAVIFRDGYYYLFASYGLAAQGVRSNYRIVVGRSHSPTGPFVDRSDKPMVEGGHTIVLNSSPPMFGPGHCDVMRDDAGRWLLAYHFYDARRFWVQDKWGLPTLQIRQLLWSDDGWPLPGLPVTAERHVGEAGGMVGRWVHQVNFTDPTIVEIRADGTAVQGDKNGAWALEHDTLTMRWPRDDVPGEYQTDTFCLAHGGRYYVGRNQAGMVVRGVRQEARR